ncbi:GNAT family N-acetyltransferase [Roseibium algae]|uniref:GNAT family N-acetyltransferase n=1 Tax=Roseibium algae TaxID=3123038 RepID=A0ABU8TQK1_9HYPH
MSVAVSIEKARPEHLVEIVAIIGAGAAGARVGRESNNAEDYRQAFDAILQAPEMDIYVALDDDGSVLATYQIHFMKGLAFKGRPRVELESVHTRADMRGQGIGAKLIEHAEALARQANAGLIQLTSNSVRTDAHRFYVRLGYDQSHLGFKKLL